MTRPTISTLEIKLDQLVQICERLNQENRKLRDQQSGWLRERTRLIEKNELARTRVEAMITRLKSLEAET
ncbi:MAG: TIGR02449 family protein [Cellvibrionaceae bacterium]